MYSKKLDEAIRRIDDAENNEKQAQWLAIKTKTPEIADFMIELGKAFGKPAAFKVSINGELITTRGFR